LNQKIESGMKDEGLKDGDWFPFFGYFKVKVSLPWL